MSKTVADFVQTMVQRGEYKSREIGVDRLAYELVFVNSDSGWRKIKQVEVSDKDRIVWLYEES